MPRLLVDRRRRRRVPSFVARVVVPVVALALGCGKPRESTPPVTSSPAGSTAGAEVDAPGTDAPQLDALRLLGLLDALADDALGGRYTLHEDIRQAARLITTRYREAGVAPAAGDDYLLDFEIMVGHDPGPGTVVQLDGKKPLTFDPATLVPRPEGTAGEAEGPLVFVGYGIARGPEAKHPFDELAGVSLKGAVAVVLEGAPRRPADADPPRSFRGRERDLGRKLQRLEEAGAAAVIVVSDPAAVRKGVDRSPPDLPDLAQDRPMRRRVEIPVVQIHATRAQAKLRWGGTHTPGSMQAEIDAKGKPRSGPMGSRRARVVVEATPRMVQAPNILAMVPGTDLADEIVLVSAHYDHIGTDEPGRGHCRARRGEPDDHICNGADDNASGSAVVAELAQVMAAGAPPRRSVVFVHFAGEEMGLLGSRHLAAHLDTTPPFVGRRVVAMLNVDMVGRLRERLTISGVGSSEGWMSLLDEVGPGGMRVLYDRSLTTRSDHAPFYERGIPALFFFTEVHGDYHAPGDESSGILREGLMQVATQVAEITYRVADGYALPFAEPRTPGETLVRALPGDNPETIIKIVGPDGVVED